MSSGLARVALLCWGAVGCGVLLRERWPGAGAGVVPGSAGGVVRVEPGAQVFGPGVPDTESGLELADAHGLAGTGAVLDVQPERVGEHLVVGGLRRHCLHICLDGRCGMAGARRGGGGNWQGGGRERGRGGVDLPA